MVVGRYRAFGKEVAFGLNNPDAAVRIYGKRYPPSKAHVSDGPRSPALRSTKRRLVEAQAAMLSYIDAFLLLAVIFTGLVPLVFLLRKPDHPSGAPPTH